jgi:hypothetical protein
MIELPFGSVSPQWPGAPLGTWLQTAPPMTNRGGGAGFSSHPPSIFSGPTLESYAMSTQAVAAPPVAGLNPGLQFAPNPVSFAVGYPLVPGLGAPTIPALLTAIAIRRGQPNGPTNDQELEDFLYDVLEVLPGTNEVEVRCDGGRATLTGSVQHKRLKHDVGEIAWTIPGIHDVQNNITITTKRRARTVAREAEPQTGGAGRKQA